MRDVCIPVTSHRTPVVSMTSGPELREWRVVVGVVQIREQRFVDRYCEVAVALTKPTVDSAVE